MFILLSSVLGTSAFMSQQGFKLQHLQAQCVMAGLLTRCEHYLHPAVVLLFFYMSQLDNLYAQKLFRGVSLQWYLVTMPTSYLSFALYTL